MNTLKVIIAWAIVAAVLIGGPLAYGGCHHLYRAQVVHHAVAPQVFYFAGQSTQDESILRKAIRAEAPALLREALQQLQAPGAQQQVAPLTGMQKCIRCHSGEGAKGGVRFDDGVDDAEFRRSVEILSGFNVPAAMKGVVGSLQPSDKGDITEAMLKSQPAKPEPQVTIPPPEESGVLR